MGQIITVEFRQDILFAVEREDGVYVAVKPICDTLGLAWQAQLQRLKRDTILAEGITVMVIPSIGGAQETVVMRLDLINGWLFTIDESRVKNDEIRQKVLAYKRECYSVLHEHFQPNRKEAPPPQIDDWLQESNTTKLKMIAEARHIFGNQSAAQIWFKVGMPQAPAMLQDQRQITLFDYSTIKSVPQEVPDADDNEDAA